MMSRSSVSPILLASALTMLWVMGCGGDDGPKRYRVSGTVTFKGKPVHYGRIMFRPDTKQGNSGPAGFADIREGKFDTSLDGGKGAVGGPHTALIDGYSDEMITMMDAGVEVQFPKPLFREFQETVDLPKEETTLHFEVPDSATRGR